MQGAAAAGRKEGRKGRDAGARRYFACSDEELIDSGSPSGKDAVMFHLSEMPKSEKTGEGKSCCG